MKNRGYLILQTLACILLALFLSFSAVSVFRDGAARRAENPTEAIYTREIAENRLAAAAPLFFFSAGLFTAGLLLHIKGESFRKPAEKTDAGRDSAQSRRLREAARMEPQTRRKGTGILQAAVLIAAIAFLILGILNGSALDVLIKAITICSECIGLG